MSLVTLCDCPKGQDVCLFCCYPEMDGYALEKYLHPSVCPRCYKREKGIFSVHTLCTATLKLYCPIVRDAGEICFDDLCRSVILARPLVRPKRDFSTFISRKIIRMFTLPLLPRFSALSNELVENILVYLDPFPELIAITYAISVAIRYRTCREPSWINTLCLKPGMTLYMTFGGFEGYAYLTAIDANPPARCSKVLQVQDELLICRDHFAIRDICSTRDKHHNGDMRDQSLFYRTLKVRDIGKKGSKIRIFSDGFFLRALVSRDAAPRAVEWNTTSSSLPRVMQWFSRSSSPRSTFNRYEYHALNDISGISAAIQGSKTIGLFCHRRDSATSFKYFVAQLERTYPSMRLIFLFFPLDRDEKIQAVGIRRIPDLRFPTNTPVIQIATNWGRTCTFGPQPQNEELFEYECLRSVCNGPILGLFYFSPSDHVPAFSEVGVSASSRCDRRHNLNLSPGESLACPPFGSPNQGWCFSKAHLQIGTKVQFCKTGETNGTCLGMLLTHYNGSREALGEIRFDRHVSESVNVQDCAVSNQMIDGKLYVLSRLWSDDCNSCSSVQWHRFPTEGKLAWWCGWNGSQIDILG